jgi:cytidylate kinase
MGIITISKGSYTRGSEIAEKVASKLGYRCISRENILQATKEFAIPEISLTRTVRNAFSILEKFSHGRERFIAHFRAALFKELKTDNVVYHGFSTHFFVEDIPPVLRVRMIEKREERINLVMEREKLSRKEAMQFLDRVDDERRKWGERLYGRDLSDPNLYDLTLNIDRLAVDEAIDSICRISKLKQFQMTPGDILELEDRAIAAQVGTFLVGIKPKVEICIAKGFVSLTTASPQHSKSVLVDRLEDMMKIPDVVGIEFVTKNDMDDEAVCLPEPSARPTKDGTPPYFTEMG